jgi:hypothetical protein
MKPMNAEQRRFCSLRQPGRPGQHARTDGRVDGGGAEHALARKRALEPRHRDRGPQGLEACHVARTGLRQKAADQRQQRREQRRLAPLGLGDGARAHR